MRVRGTRLALYFVMLGLLAGGPSSRRVGAGTPSTNRVSVDSAGVQADEDSRSSAISANGRFVAFASSASNLVPGDTNNSSDVFVHDRETQATTRVSVDSAGRQADYYSYAPSISADGRFVAFSSIATNLVPGDTNGRFDIFVYNRGQ